MNAPPPLGHDEERRPIHLLLVEDSPADAKLVEIELGTIRMLDLRTHWCKTMAAALAHLRDSPADVVLLDLSLPDTHGLGSIAAIKSVRPQTPIVVLTGDSNPTRGEQTVAMGAQDYMFKGDVSGHALERAIRYALLRATNDRLQREQQRQQARREQVEVVERLSAAIAHELNNALTIVRSASELLGMPDLDIGERAEFEAAVVDGVERATAIADQLFALGGGRPFRTTRTDLGQVLETLIPLLGRVLGPRAKLELGRVSSRVIEASQGTVERAVKLLVLALVDHLDEARGRLDGREAAVSPAPCIELSVQPDGGSFSLVVTADMALSEAQAAAVSDDLTLRAVARTARGRLSCTPTTHGGKPFTRLEVRFTDRFGEISPSAAPKVVDQVPSASPIEGLEALLGRSVLVVEDEEGVRRAVSRLVASLGLEAVTAASAEEATHQLDDAAARGRTFAALVVDVRLPGRDGLGFVRQVLRDHGAVPVVFMSGFNDDFAAADDLDTRWELLPKPFSRRDMAQALIRVTAAHGR